MKACERCGHLPRFGKKRYRCAICNRLVCVDCCESIERTRGQRSVWCLRGESTGRFHNDAGRVLLDDCKEQVTT